MKITALILSVLLLLLAGACEQPVDSPEPGESGYVPSHWVDPDLAYALQEYFPVNIREVKAAPGQFLHHEEYGVELAFHRLSQGPSGGGLYGPDSSTSVSLGMAGGHVILEFQPPLEDHEQNMGGYEFIVYGNSFWNGGDPLSPTREPGVIQVMADENGNSLPDDTWYLIPGSHLSSADQPVDVQYGYDSIQEELTWSCSNDSYDGSTPAVEGWWDSSSLEGYLFEQVWLLPEELYSGGMDFALFWGYADSAPTMVRGDLNGDGDNRDPEDYPGIPPEFFYTVPDRHGDSVIDPGSGGGTAVDIQWAVDSQFQPAGIGEVSWIKITSASLEVHDLLGEYSPELDRVVRVRRGQIGE